MKSWSNCKHVLCIRADNMGDLLMSSPAIRALKQSFSCRITVLTSTMTTAMAPFIPEIDEVLTYNLPWVKTNQALDSGSVSGVAEMIRKMNFDAAVVFTVYSQNPLPAVMLAYMAGIPLRLAYCRENPYDLLTHWVPDKEPYSFIKHQVRRDLDLVAAVGAVPQHDRLILDVPNTRWPQVLEKLRHTGIDTESPWVVMHAGVSEKKREYPFENWVEAGRRIVAEQRQQVLLTGVQQEKELTDRLQHQIGAGSFSVAGLFGLEEYILLIREALLVISVNTGTIHIAAATSTPLVVLYALTNPQHLPWRALGKVLAYSISEADRSRNEVIRFVHDRLFPPRIERVSADDIVQAVSAVLHNPAAYAMPEMVPLQPVPAE